LLLYNYSLVLLQFRNNVEFQRWSVSGDIKCYAGSHIALVVLALTSVLVITTIVPLFAVLTSFKVRSKRKAKIHFY